jgi:hypothetical protein
MRKRADHRDDWQARMKAKLINFAAFQVGWFACILSAAWGHAWLGVLYVLLWAAAHVWMSMNRVVELRLLGLVGYAADSVLVLTGVLAFPEQAVMGWPSTLWMTAMWVNFATTLNASLGWLRGRYSLGAAFGFIGGPMAYFGGAQLGAVTLAEPMWRSLLVVGIEWAIATPLLLVLVRIVANAGPHAAASPAREAMP